MASIARRIAPIVVQTLTSPQTRGVARGFAELRRRLRGEPHRVQYFHQVDDPYSHLCAQTLTELVERYDVVLEPHLVGPPPDEAAPEREHLEDFARRDSADVAPKYGLSFPDRSDPPKAEAVDLATRMLAGAIERGAFPEAAAQVGDALWSGDGAPLDALASAIPPADADAARRAVAEGSALRHEQGHYLGAMLHYGGGWYWGVDRLHHLERRLRGLGVARSDRADWIAPRPTPAPIRGGGDRRLTLEFFPSLRSPYTAIVMDRVLDLVARTPVDLSLRPVLPMVMRGLPVPRAKQLYILFDTKREAEDAGVPFGRMCDPVGRPVERAFSLYPWAREQGRAAQLLASFTRASFAEGVDTGTDEGLRYVVERAGLPWSGAREHLDGEGWRDELEENRKALLEMGLWGVPSFRLLGSGGEPDYSTWGQDRLWRVEQEIGRRLGSPPDA